MGPQLDLPNASILIVEDNLQQRSLYGQALVNYRLTCVSTGTEALALLREAKFDLIILDHILEGGEKGISFLPKLKEVAAHVPVIVISGALDVQGQLSALQGPRAASFVISKPVDLDVLDRMVEIALTECGFGEAVSILQSLEHAENPDSKEPDRRYLARLERQHGLLKRLRASSGPAIVSKLSRDFGVARRTIVRDLRELIQRGQITPDHYPAWDEEDPLD